MASAVARSWGTKTDLSSRSETRPAWVDTLMAASARAPAVAHDGRRAAHADLELLVQHGVAEPADLDDGRPQLVRAGQRLVGQRLDVGPGEEGVELVVGELGQEGPSEGGGRRRQAGAERDRDGHDPLRRDPGHVDDHVVVEHGRGDGLVHPLRELLHVGLGDVGQLQRGDIGVAEVQHAGRELEVAAVRAHVAERLEGEEQPARRGPGQAGRAGHLGQRHGRLVGREGPQHSEAALQRLHELRRACRTLAVHGHRP